MAGLYIHIPFCESRCIYCGFYSTTSLKLRDDYVDALCKEMKMRPITQALGANYPIQTIYLGGGTPSQLTSEQLQRLFEGIKATYFTQKANTDAINTPGMPADMEITMECNPDDVTEDFCETIKALPINRISMGAQTFSDKRLRFLHRRHNAAEVELAVKRLRHIGIKNISIDLMFGFPNETLQEWEEDIEQAINLHVEHISAYSLMYEEDTPLYRMLESGKIQEIDEESSLAMYETLIDKLTDAGYEHYEVSNFALPGYRSRHNSSYWHEIPYIGIGASAHSYKRAGYDEERTKKDRKKITSREVTRSWNIDNIQEYISSIQRGELPSEQETLDLNTRYNDLITTALRTSDGIDLQHLKKEFGEQLLLRFINEADRHIRRGLMKESNGRISLTRKGLYISDDIMSDFMIVDE